MESLFLQNTDINVSRLCIGGCPMGRYGWGNVSRRDSIAMVHSALLKGLNFYDTADIYGMGEAERTLGDALKGYRDKVVINTKFGVRKSSTGKTFYDNSPEWIETALSNSLRRLKTDYIDVYQIHYRDNKVPMLDVVEVLERVKQQGKIRSYGLSNISRTDRLELTAAGNVFCSFQNEYSLAKRSLEADILELCNDFSMTPMTWGSLGQGILTGKYNETSRFAHNDRRSRKTYVNFHGNQLFFNMKIVDRLRELARNKQVTIPSVAIRWILNQIPDSVVIVGLKKPEQLIDNLDAFSLSLSTEEMDSLNVISDPKTLETRSVNTDSMKKGR